MSSTLIIIAVLVLAIIGFIVWLVRFSGKAGSALTASEWLENEIRENKLTDLQLAELREAVKKIDEDTMQKLNEGAGDDGRDTRARDIFGGVRPAGNPRVRLPLPNRTPDPD